MAILLLFLTSASLNFINAVSSLLYTALLPFAMIVSTLLYYDLRTREAGAAKLDAEIADESVRADQPP